ncbi:hypothetical protein BC831DRAFT_456516 [Entophlyctis helioformis]|nr:hypothetical protein BC831DRAFT_456516 [Entophlyctis helioformis]
MIVTLESPHTKATYSVDGCDAATSIQQVKHRLCEQSGVECLPASVFLSTLDGSPVDEAAVLQELETDGCVRLLVFFGEGGRESVRGNTQPGLLEQDAGLGIESVAAAVLPGAGFIKATQSTRRPMYGSVSVTIDSEHARSRSAIVRKSYISSATALAPPQIVGQPGTLIIGSPVLTDGGSVPAVVEEECVICDKPTVTACSSCARPVCDKCGYDPRGSSASSPPSAHFPNGTFPRPHPPATSRHLQGGVRPASWNASESTDSIALSVGTPHTGRRGSRDQLLSAHDDAADTDHADTDALVPPSNVSAQPRASRLSHTDTARGTDSVVLAPRESGAGGRPQPKPDFWFLLCPECRQSREARLKERRLSLLRKLAVAIIMLVLVIVFFIVQKSP